MTAPAFKKAPTEAAIEDALAALIANTKRVRRKLNLLEIADKLDIAIAGLGSVETVADRVSLSSEMLRQFRTVGKLCTPVKRLIEERRIESVDIAHRLSKLPPREQALVASAVVHGDLRSDDARAIIALKRDVPQLRIPDVIRRVRKTRAIKRYLILFAWPSGRTPEKRLRDRFVSLLGKDAAIDLRHTHGLGVLTISSVGKERFQSLAREARVSKQFLLDKIIHAVAG
jgi:hypothetical protein